LTDSHGFYLGAGTDPQAGQCPEYPGILIVDPDYVDRLPGGNRQQGTVVDRGQQSVGRGDGSPVGIPLWVAEPLGEVLPYVFRRIMLESVSLGVDRVP